MKNLKSNLTKLETKVAAQIPAGDDVFDFKGVSREMVLNEIGKIKKILDNLENQGEINFEIIALKRMSSKLHERLNDLADKGFEDKEIFNEFLTTLSTLSDKTLITYFMVNKNGFRSDEELLNIKTKIQERENTIKELSEICVQYKTLSETLLSIKATADSTIEAAKHINNINVNVKKEKDEIFSLSTKIKEKNKESIAIGKNISDLSNKILETSKNSESLNQRSTQLSDDLETLKIQVQKNVDKSNETLTKINAMLDGATRIGLANSFASRKNEVKESQNLWEFIFMLSIIGMTVLLFFTTRNFPIDLLNPTSYLNIIPKILIVGPALWLAWFASKQYSILDKIKEDYSFKYALSMAYDGYKKAIETVTDKENKELTKSLLNSILNAISFNPTALFSKNEICSPWESMFLDKSIKANVDPEKGLSVEYSKETSK